MALKWRGNEMKTVTHVYAHFVTHVLAPCREGNRVEGLKNTIRHRGFYFRRRPASFQHRDRAAQHGAEAGRDQDFLEAG